MKPTQQDLIKIARLAGFHVGDQFVAGASEDDLKRFVTLLLERFGAGGGEPVAAAVFDEHLGRPALIEGAPLLNHGQVLYTHPSPTDLRAEYLRALGDAKKVALDADHMGSVNLKLMKNRISNAIEALKCKQ